MELLESTRLALAAPTGPVSPATVCSGQERSVLPLAGLRGLIFAGAGLILLAAPIPANELGVATTPSSSRIVIHDADETLRDWCRRDARGVLWLALPGGARFELVTSVSDPVITNRGDGAFHVFDAADARAALSGVQYPLEGLAVDVFILPYPRRGGLSSAAGPGLILLSPGVYPLPREQQHKEFCHELGHVVQYARMPDGAVASWDRYRALRDIDDASVYWEGADHADRPHEIFAEDFRALFGDRLATAIGSVENGSLVPPARVPGLASFMLDLAVPTPRLALSARPNPARGPITFTCAGTGPVPLDIFDLAGRRIVTLEPETAADGVRWVWDGRDGAGRGVGPGVVFARARDARALPGALRVILLP